MSGGRKVNTVPDYTGQALQTSTMVSCVPFAGGLVRVTPNLIYYTDYEVHSSTNKGAGGKGGGKTKTYTYSASIILAMCEGEIMNVTKTWVDQGFYTGYTTTGFLLFKGTIPQAPWPYLALAHPEDAFGYQGIAYMAAKNYNLGSTPAAPQHSFEVQAPGYNTGYTGAGDEDCALLIDRFLTNTEYGALFPSTFIDTTSYSGGSLMSGPDATTTGDSAYQTYCRVNGWGLSVFINNQEPATDILSRWLQLTNTAPVWTGYSLKFIPWGDAAITGNGATYLPPTSNEFNFTDDDYIQDKDAAPVQVSLSDWYDASNSLAVEVCDRTNNYNTVPIDVIDQTQNELIGRRPGSTVQGHEICYLPMAFQVASLLEQRMVYVRENFKFTVGPEYSELEPMDCGTITDSVLSLVEYSVRIREIEEQDDGSLTLTCEEFPGTLGLPVGQTTQGGVRSYVNQQVVPDPVNDPIIFEPNSAAAARLNNGATYAILCILASGGLAGVADPNFGGAIVNVSTDGGATYGEIGIVPGPARQGYLTANLPSFSGPNPDTTNTLAVNLAESAGTLASASTSTDAANGVTLGIVQDGVCSTSYELLSYENVTVVGTNVYDLTSNYRGQYGTTAGAHTTGALYGRLDQALFMFQMPIGYIDIPLKIKLQSFNTFGAQIQDISTCTEYDYTPTGAGYGGGSGGVPTEPTGLSTPNGGIGQNAISWNTNPATDNVTSYQVWATNGPGGSFGSATVIWQGLGTSYIETGLSTDVVRTYFIVAMNVVGSSAPTAGSDATTSSTAVAGKQPFGPVFSTTDVSQCAGKTMRASIDIAWTFPATTSTPAGSLSGHVQTAPSSGNVAIDLQKDGVSVGTCTFNSGSQTPVLTKTSDTAFVAGDYLDAVFPSNLDGMSGPFSINTLGTRP